MDALCGWMTRDSFVRSFIHCPRWDIRLQWMTHVFARQTSILGTTRENNFRDCSAAEEGPKTTWLKGDLI